MRSVTPPTKPSRNQAPAVVPAPQDQCGPGGVGGLPSHDFFASQEALTPNHAFPFSMVKLFLIIAQAFSLFSGQAAAPPDWQSGHGFRSRPLNVPASSGKRAGFVQVDALAAGILFTNRLDDERSLTNQIFLNGSGVAAGDVDGDGLCDLYFCGLDASNALFRNLGNWTFQDATSTAGVACADQASTGAAIADVDGDRDLDLLVNGIARGTRLFLNDGRGRFQEATDDAGLRSKAGSTSMALADIDGDGRIDLYVVNYRNDTMRDMPDIRFRVGVTQGVSQLVSVNGRPVTDPDLAGRFTLAQNNGVLENGEADDWFLNRGQGRFERLKWTEGRFLDERGQPMTVPYDWGLSAMFRDLNGDSAPDLYVCNDFQSPDRLWMNDGKGGFRAGSPAVLRQTSLFSMGIDFADFDRDGHDDFFVADMLSREHERRQVQVMDAMALAQFRRSTSERPQFPRNMLFRNRGDGTFAEIAQFAGVDASDWTWCPVFLDVDLDGYEDLLTVTGHWRDAQHADLSRQIEAEKSRQRLSPREQLRLRRRFPRLDTPNFAFRNRGDATFEEMGAAWGFDAKAVSQGIALADLDNDGDLDIAINTLNEPPILCRNSTSAGRVAVRLRGADLNSQGIGARIRFNAPGLPAQSQEMICGGRYLSGDEALRVFATGNAAAGLSLEVTWRDGRRNWVTNVSPNALYEIDQTTAQPASPSSKPASTPLFSAASGLLNHRHVDEPFDDVTRQPLLPHVLSEFGPGITWFDFNRDGWDDLIIGAGRGGRLGVFRNDGRGGFVRQRSALFEKPSPTDQTTILGWRGRNPQNGLLFGSAEDDSQNPPGPAVTLVSLVDGTSNALTLPSANPTGPMAMTDIDRDGDLDLFVGTHRTAGRYPLPAASVMFRNDGGQFILDPRHTPTLDDLGLARGAVFSDQDGDGWQDLVVACEWGPIRMFRNGAEGLQAIDPAIRVNEKSAASFSGVDRLSQLTGWWTGVAAGDLDNDGRLDLVVGNWGRNTPRHPTPRSPIELHYADVEGTGRFALLETWQDPATGRRWPHRDWSALSLGFPMIQEKFPTFASLSVAEVPSLLAVLPPTASVRAATLDSVLLLNRGDHYEVAPLPVEAQLSPVFGVALGDLDGDGNVDVVLSQNFRGVAAVESRHDAGLGLWLRGDGHGQLDPIPAAASGLRLDGDGRGLALADFDQDGRWDLAIGQHQGSSALYRNALARPGRRIQCEGSAENPAAVGASVRAVTRGTPTGPRHEIQLGSGFWSQNSHTLILADDPAIDAIDIRWPGGATERHALAPGPSPVVLRRSDSPPPQ
ncbi:MAG: VCBS repeat-containing protein [Verrucomicrobiales bacterium]|nr:VCBS repeat-containing protein [Verrucomicrobiales bacterium]